VLRQEIFDPTTRNTRVVSGDFARREGAAVFGEVDRL